MLLTDADQLREALAITLRERDEARAEVERLTEERDRVARELRRIDEHGSLRAAIRAAAERQREACAKVAYLYADLNYDSDTVEAKVQATPLVTEGDE